MGFGPSFAKKALLLRKCYPYGAVLPVAPKPDPEAVKRAGVYGPFCRMPRGDGTNEWRFETLEGVARFVKDFGGDLI